MGGIKPKVEVLCEECGKPFLVYPCRSFGPDAKRYCSLECGKIGGGRKRSAWGKLNRKDLDYREAQSVRTKKSWEDPENRARHLAAMHTPEYHVMRVANGIRITSTQSFRDAVREYNLSPRAKINIAKRRKPSWPNWVTYISPDGSIHKFKSTWEKTIAESLDDLQWTWEYEPKRFTLDDGSTYLPDFLVHSTFGSFYVEVHRLEDIRPGDEAKVAKLYRISSGNLLDAPLLLMGEGDVNNLRKLSHKPLR